MIQCVFYSETCHKSVGFSSSLYTGKFSKQPATCCGNSGITYMSHYFAVIFAGFIITTSFDIASFFIENFYFFLISFVNKSRVSEFCCVFLYHMITSIHHIFCESCSVFLFSVFVFSSSNH